MTVNANIIQLLRESIGGEIKTCNKEEYFNNTPHFNEVCDIVKDNDTLILLTR